MSAEPVRSDAQTAASSGHSGGHDDRVPMIEVVVEVDGHSFEEVDYTVAGLLLRKPHDVHCRLVGRWASLGDGAGEDALHEQRLIHEKYATEARVVLSEDLPATCSASFRLHLPPGWRPGENTMEELAKDMQERELGLRSVLLPDGRVARLESTEAFEHAERVMQPGDDLDDVVDAVSKTWWSEGVEDGFLHPVHAPHVTRPSATRPPAPKTTELPPAAPANTLGSRGDQPPAPVARIRRLARRIRPRSHDDPS
ncbi:MAG TPA: hypothetical protein VLB29_00825 [Nocardioidaceae bacterium]|nr:hypothetical protein [Nocardioidaceae bacterium]